MFDFISQNSNVLVTGPFYCLNRPNVKSGVTFPIIVPIDLCFINFRLWGGAVSHQPPLPLSWAPLSLHTQDIENLTLCYHSQFVNTENNGASH